MIAWFIWFLCSSISTGVASDLSSTRSTYKTLYYNQTLDHTNTFHPNTPRWSHRYLLNDDHWGTKPLFSSCPGPILMYTGNEADITAFWSGNGFMIDYLAPKWGALVVFPEQRYYGESIPSSSMEYLTTQNVLEDFVELLDYVKKQYKAESCPVVAFGGSYGATLTTFLRSTYPFAVIGGLASSAPTGYYDPENWDTYGVSPYTFSDIVTKNYDAVDPQCLDAISAAREVMDESTVDELVRAYNLCDADGSGLGPKHSDLFLYSLEGLCQQNYPYAIGNMPAWPVTVACDTLVRAYNSDENILDAAVEVTYMALGADRDTCMPTIGPQGPGNIPGDGPGPGQWGYQSCTETLHKFSSRGIRNYSFDYTTSAYEPCMSNYHITPDPNALTSRYGGYSLVNGDADITNIIWSNGALDPWSGGGFYPQYAPKDAAKRGMHFFMLETGAHHLDLRGPHPNDPAEVTTVRQHEEKIIWEWIQEFVYSHEGV